MTTGNLLNANVLHSCEHLLVYCIQPERIIGLCLLSGQREALERNVTVPPQQLGGNTTATYLRGCWSQGSSWRARTVTDHIGSGAEERWEAARTNSRGGREARPWLAGWGGPIPGAPCAACASPSTLLGFRGWFLCKAPARGCLVSNVPFCACSAFFRSAAGLRALLLPRCQKSGWGSAGPGAPVAFSSAEPS